MKISLAGVPGSGKSTLRYNLAEKFNLTIKGTGDFMRTIAQEHGYNDITQFLVEYVSHHSEVDHQVDNAQKQFGEENDNFVLDAHLGFLFVPDSIKIFLTCDPIVTAQRILEARRATEEAQDFKEALAANQRRMKTMQKNFKTLYNVDMYDETNYDLILDTTQLTPEEVTQKVSDYILSQSPSKCSSLPDNESS